jgi:glycosyltransferase involved in cell wall biosynthesis
MRIVYVLTSLGVGGAERQVLALGARMAERGHTVALMVLRPRLNEEWPTALDVVHLDMRRNPISVIAALLRARRFLKQFRPDLVHSHSFHANLMARLLKLLLSSTKVLSTVHNVYEGGLHRMVAYRLTDFLSVRTTAVSTAAAERFVRLKAVPQQKCIVVTNGIDTAEFAPSADRRAQTRAALGVTNEFIWLTAGRIAPAKDIPNLLRAFKLVRTAHPTAQLWIAGAGDPTTGQRTSSSAPDPAAQENVHWLGLRRDLPALLDAADGFVLASAWEGMPLVVGEAMAMEKPVVATDVGGVRELVGDAGVLVPPSDSNALADAMIALMQSPAEDRQTLGVAARSRIATEFSIDARADQWERLYLSLLAPGR